MDDSKNAGAAAVLIVDDYADTRTIVKWSLELRGYRVIEAASGEEALLIASRERPDLILMDLNMPLMDGYATMRALRSQEALRGTPIVAVTAQDMAASRERANQAGCTEYLSKPIDFDRLEVLIDRLVEPAS